MGAPGHDIPMAKLMLHGDLDHPATLSAADLREWVQHRAEVTFDCATNGPQHHVFEGPLLRDVVAHAGPAFDARRRKDRSRFLIAVSGGDGHHTVLSWAELDADFGNNPVLLATRLDGEDLDEAGCQRTCAGRATSARSRTCGSARCPRRAWACDEAGQVTTRGR